MSAIMNVRKTKRILVALDMTHESGREHLSGFYRYAGRHRDWQVRLIPCSEPTYLPMVEKALREKLDGAVIKAETASVLAAPLIASGVPVVFIDRPLQGTEGRGPRSCVAIDNARLGAVAAEYFDSLGQYSSYLFVPDAFDRGWSRSRGEAFARAVRAQGHDCRIHAVGLEPGGREDLAELARLLRSLPKPIAVLAAFDQRAANVLSACETAHLKVPEQVAVVGVDDDVLVCEHARPKLTSIHPDHVGQGQSAAHELDLLMAAKVPRSRRGVVCGEYTLVERDSASPVTPSVHLVREAMAYLDAHALERIRVADVVAALGVSARLANLRFTSLVGHSIRDELVERRMKEVERLLVESDYPLTRIAAYTGFKSGAILAHLFVRRHGRSMRAWRAERKKGQTPLIQ